MSNDDMRTIPLGLWPDANRIAVDPVEYQDSWYKYEVLSNIQLRGSDTAVVSGYGVHLKVEYDSLVAECELGHVPGRRKLLRLDRGVHKMRQIFISSHGGYVSFEAIDWCAQQDITVFLLNWRDDVVAVLTPRQSRSARVVYLQYAASQSKQGVEIARELIRCKTMQQMVALEQVPEHVIRSGKDRLVLFQEGNRVMISSRVEYGSPMEQFEVGLEKLVSLSDIDSIRMLEAQLARAYWSLFVGISIPWERSDREKVPRHWQKVPERVSGISSSRTAQHATNPFHSTLNFAYALLKAQVLQSILVHGLDETVGFLHVSREGGQPFVYDLMEPFRSIVDMSVLNIFGKQVFKKGDFIQTTTGECQLNEGLRRYVVAKCRVPDRDIDDFVERIMGYL
jgi:CRISPR-associated endonuclease Cas1